jgi:pyruvate/2-oxoglutarate dehydrogenase complex dihydrolipoamide acyltransferase (E2) component
VKKKKTSTKATKSAKKAASAAKPQTATATTRKKKKTPQGKNIGKKARVRAGRMAGERGVIVRQDEYLGTYFMNMERCQNDPVYQDIEWGPYFESQLELLKK